MASIGTYQIHREEPSELYLSRPEELKLIRLRYKLKNNLKAWDIIAETFNCSQKPLKDRYKKLRSSDEDDIQQAFANFPCPDKRVTVHRWTKNESARISALAAQGLDKRQIAPIVRDEFSIDVNEKAVEGRLRTMQTLQNGRSFSKRKRSCNRQTSKGAANKALKSETACASRAKRSRTEMEMYEDIDEMHLSSKEEKAVSAASSIPLSVNRAYIKKEIEEIQEESLSSAKEEKDTSTASCAQLSVKIEHPVQETSYKGKEKDFSYLEFLLSGEPKLESPQEASSYSFEEHLMLQRNMDALAAYQHKISHPSSFDSQNFGSSYKQGGEIEPMPSGRMDYPDESSSSMETLSPSSSSDNLIYDGSRDAQIENFPSPTIAIEDLYTENLSVPLEHVYQTPEEFVSAFEFK